ncbi:MAG TPA: transglutaminase domain-containing protein [Dehalococcoidia bacterium]|nr:transglutaminase domain-containing protein [Dehalococcoidia bacterium]
MSQANWIEYFRTQSQPVEEPEQPQIRLPAWITDWETWLTLALSLLVFLSVARSIESAHWVDGMPSLTLLSLIGICVGFALSRIRIPEAILDVLALLIGTPIVLGMTLSYMHATSVSAGLPGFLHRFGDWFLLVRTGGISNDVMPFIAMVLALTWIAAFLSAWSIFRWHNAWIALIPGGIGLLTNISYLPGQFSIDFVVFLFGSMLLVMRSNLRNRERDWVRKGLQYPSFISLTLLNATVWVAVGLLIAAWIIPLASEAPVVSTVWNAISSPFTGATDWSRLFSSIDSKREVPLHNFGQTLPLQGKVVLSDREVVEVDFGDQSNYGRNLRAAVYDEYTPTGWKAGTRQPADFGSNGVAGSDPAKGQSAFRDRKNVTVSILVETPEQALISIGEPVSSNMDSRAEVINESAGSDVGAIRPRKALKPGDTYTETGSVSQASVESLQAASSNYPEWLRTRYTQLPQSLPPRVRDYAQQLTQGKANGFDKATAVETALRALPDTYDIPSVPPGRDAVDYFLFDLKRGYSDYHASAMVVLLRSLGIPARLATGFSVGEFDLNSHRYVIREQNAISWPEVYFPGYGWEEFSPFGGSPLVNRPSSAAAGTGDDTSGNVQDPNADDTPDDTGDAGGAALNANRGPDALRIMLYAGFGMLVLLGLGAIGGVGARIAWERGMNELDYPAQLWEKSIRLATWARLAPRPCQTPAEYGSQLRRALPDAAGIQPIAESYLRSRFGRKSADSEERTRLKTQWISLRNALLRRVLHWRR